MVFDISGILLRNVFLARYLMKMPPYFEQGIEQLHANKYVEEKVGDFNSYSYKKDQLPKETDNPAIFDIELIGDSINLYLTCTMVKTKEKWYLAKIKPDSVTKNP